MVLALIKNVGGDAGTFICGVSSHEEAQGRAVAGWEAVAGNTNAVPPIQIESSKMKPADTGEKEGLPMIAIRSKFGGTWSDVEKSVEWRAERLNTCPAEAKAGTPETEM